MPRLEIDALSPYRKPETGNRKPETGNRKITLRPRKLKSKFLLQAIRSGDLESVAKNLDDGANIETPDAYGKRGLPLRIACFHGYNHIIRELLKRGANPNHLPASDEQAPVQIAIRQKKIETLGILLAHGACLPENTGEFPFPERPRPPSKNAEKHDHLADAYFEEVHIEPCHGLDTGRLDANIENASEGHTATMLPHPLPTKENLRHAISKLLNGWKTDANH